MSRDRDTFAARLESLSDKPNTVIRLCMEQYDARAAAEQKLLEMKNQWKAQEELYRKLQGNYAALVKESAGYRDFFSGYEARLASMTETYEDMRKRYEAAAGENDLLREANTELTRKYVDTVEAGRSTQQKLETALQENRELHSRILALQEQIKLGNRERFGAGTEKTSAFFGKTEPDKDPLDESAADPNTPEAEADREGAGQPVDYSAESVLKKVAGKITGQPKKPSGQRTPRPKGKREKDYSGMDQVNHYNYDPEELDRRFGKGNYRIVNFKCRRTIRETRPHNYVYNEYTPVIVVRDEEGKEKIKTLEQAPVLYPGSPASESLVTSILTRRFQMALPLFRLEQEYLSRGVPLSRQTMSNWVIHFALEVFAPVRDRMWAELDKSALVRQCDETTWRVVIWPEEEGTEKRKNGSKGYIWLHTTGEFTRGHKVLIYAFERSRGADHLRRTLKEMAGYLISDAYCVYHTMENESGGRIRSAMCWMHCRRALARAVLVMEPGLDRLSAREIGKAPEVQGLLLANDIFEADTPLKELTSEERLLKRKEIVAPRVDRFFSFIHGLDEEALARSEKLREAVTYAINQEANLKVFLENGDIPLDNGYCERGMKPVALARRNSLFSYTMIGAECNAIMYSIVETARANGADVYTYLKYLLREVPNHLDGKDRSFLDDMMPWSLPYLSFERYEREHHTDEKVPESMDPPQGLRTSGKDVA